MVNSYFIYYSTIILASFFAWLSQKYANDKENDFKLNKIFFWLSIISLSLTMGLRTTNVGIDDYNYKLIFDEVRTNGIWDYFMRTKIEIGYLLFNQIIGFFTDNFQVVMFLTSLIPIVLFYKAIEYERKNINLFLNVFLFGSILYLYFYGIIRLFIAVSIVMFALRYVFENKTKKFILAILIASLFHYSSLFMLIFLYFTTQKKEKSRSKEIFIIIVAIIIPIITLILVQIVIPNLQQSKYSLYKLNQNVHISINDFDKLAFIIIALILRKKLIQENKRIDIYILMYILAFIITIYSKFVEIGRLQWYLMFSICVIFPTIIRAFYKFKYKYLSFLLTLCMFAYGSLYSYRIINEEPRKKGMTNYESIMFLDVNCNKL